MQPLSLLDGGPPARVMRGLQARLHEVFPRARFNHQLVPPRMTPQLWARLTEKCPFVGLGWSDWRFKPANRLRGELAFNLFLVTRNRPDWLLLGDKTAPGVFGMVCTALAAMHRYTVGEPGEPPLGTVMAEQAGGLFSEDWVADDLGTAGIVLRVPEVALVDDALTDELPDFLQLGSAWDFEGDAVESVGNVRGVAG